jgi:hypothetical protein
MSLVPVNRLDPGQAELPDGKKPNQIKLGGTV